MDIKLLCVNFLLTATFVKAQSPSPFPALNCPSVIDLECLNQRVLEYVNEFRVSEGVAPLSMGSKFMLENAKDHSITMSTADDLSHQKLQNPSLFVGDASCQIQITGENVALHGSTSINPAYKCFDQWKNSEGHRANMVRNTFKSTVTGFYFNITSGVTYCTQTFANVEASGTGDCSAALFSDSSSPTPSSSQIPASPSSSPSSTSSSSPTSSLIPSSSLSSTPTPTISSTPSTSIVTTRTPSNSPSSSPTASTSTIPSPTRTSSTSASVPVTSTDIPSPTSSPSSTSSTSIIPTPTSNSTPSTSIAATTKPSNTPSSSPTASTSTIPSPSPSSSTSPTVTPTPSTSTVQSVSSTPTSSSSPTNSPTSTPTTSSSFIRSSSPSTSATPSSSTIPSSSASGSTSPTISASISMTASTTLTPTHTPTPTISTSASVTPSNSEGATPFPSTSEGSVEASPSPTPSPSAAGVVRVVADVVNIPVDGSEVESEVDVPEDVEGEGANVNDAVVLEDFRVDGDFSNLDSTNRMPANRFFNTLSRQTNPQSPAVSIILDFNGERIEFFARVNCAGSLQPIDPPVAIATQLVETKNGRPGITFTAQVQGDYGNGCIPRFRFTTRLSINPSPSPSPILPTPSVSISPGASTSQTSSVSPSVSATPSVSSSPSVAPASTRQSTRCRYTIRGLFCRANRKRKQIQRKALRKLYRFLGNSRRNRKKRRGYGGLWY